MKTPRTSRGRSDRNSVKDPIALQSAALDEAERPKRGRRTIPDNFLLGHRNAWAALLEESWPEIGWHLQRIRSRRSSTIEDLRKAFEPVKQQPHNPGLAAHFYRESFEAATPADIRTNGKQVSKLDGEILQTETKHAAQLRSCLEVESALKEVGLSERDVIQDEGARRQQRRLQLEADLEKLRLERADLNRRLLDQESYVSRSELLDFLLSGRYAITPRNIANALAGLPWMRWRQSYVRCSRMSFNEPRLQYRVFEAISRIWSRVPEESKRPSIEFFQAELLRLPKKSGYIRQFLCDNWRDLKLAIGECLTSRQPPTSTPFVLTSIFMRNVTRQKTAAERILMERDRLAIVLKR